MNFEQLKKNLEDINFYKKHIPNLFFIISFWKKTFKEYQAAQEKSIVPAYLLRKSEHEDFHYNTYAISINGEIAPALVEELKVFANGLDLGEIRFMSHATNGFFPMVDAQGLSVDLPEIKLPAGIYIYSLSDTKPAIIDCPCAVLIKNGVEIKKWAISRAALS